MISAFEKAISLVLVFLIINCSIIFGKGNKADIDVISDNITSSLLDGTMGQFSGSDIWDADGIVSRIAFDENGNGYFADIDYSNPDRATWPAARHLTRTERLAIIYRNENDAEKKSVYREAILKLLDYWIDKDYQNSNWWHNQLSNPNIIGEIGILMKNDLNEDQIFELAQLVGRGCFTVNPLLLRYTGANATDIAMSSIKFGVLTGSGNAIKTAVRVVANELDYSLLEGLKKDNTYFQHGNRLYMGGYGVEFISGMTRIIGMLTGTGYGFSEKQLTPFAGFILDGMQVMSFGSILDPTTMGRSVSRVNAQPLRGVASSLLKLADTAEMPRKDELRAYAASIMNDTKSDYGLKYFDKAKFLVINNSDFYFSFRGGDSKMFYSEIINNENILSYNSSYPGVTTIMHTGAELKDISPVYNYSLVPGTTAVYEGDEELANHGDFSNRALVGTYGDKVADGAAVVFAKTEHDGISMTVSCFATDNAAVLLGAGMNDSKGRQLFTTLDQAFASGEYVQNGNVVINNGIKYTVLEGENPVASVNHIFGDWRRNNLTIPNIPAEGDVFTLFMPCSGSYAYSVMAENTEADFKVIVNTDRIQAVQLPDGRVAASFIKKGEFNFEGRTYSGKAGKAYIFE